MGTYREAAGLLRDRHFALLFVARVVSMTALSSVFVALAFGVLDLPGADARTLSLVLAAEMAPLAVFQLAGGVVADRYPRRTVLLTGEVMSALAWLATGLMITSRWAPLPLLCAAAALSGLAGAAVWPALNGIVPQLVPNDRLQEGNALLSLANNIARLVGLVGSGTVVVLIGPGPALLAAAGMFALSAVCILRLRVPGTTDRPGESALTQLRHGWREFSSRQWLWVVVAQFSVMVAAIEAAHGVLGPLVAKTELGGPAAWTAVLTGEALGMVTGVLLAVRLRPRRPILMATLIAVPACLVYLALGLRAPLWLCVAGAFVMGACFDVFGVLWHTTMQQQVPPDALSRVSSYDALGSLMFGPIGLLVAGPLAVHLGPHPALVGCWAVCLVTTLLALLSPSVRTLAAEPVDDAVPAPAEVVGG